MPPLTVEPFEIHVDDDVLTDLRERIRRTRWPDPAPAEPWRQGTDLDYLRGLLDYWADGFDWPAQQRRLDELPQFRAEIDGVKIHFVHEKARNGDGIPLVLTSGWPSNFVELLPLVPLLTDPDTGPAFDVVIPSLPGYGFSERPRRTGVNYRYVARLWHQLMRGLGYQRYGAHGSDFGGGVAALMAYDDPAPMIGLHLTDMDISPAYPERNELSQQERDYLDHHAEWWQGEGGYKAIQSTKPQTLGYALNDSPAGLAAWVCEKWHSWSDSHGSLDRHRDLLLTILTIYWATGSITSSMRDYYDNRWHPVSPDRITVPTGFAVFSHQYVPEGEPPREWAQRQYDVRRWTRMPRGGHFPAAEEPELLATDIRAFFGDL